MVEVHDLRKSFGDKPVLKGISFTVTSGELFAYLGPNGAGKTTTIRILTGLSRHGGGTVSLNGRDIGIDPQGAKAQFGLVPQHTNLDGELSVAENLLIHGRLHGMTLGEIRHRIELLLEYVEMSDRAPDQVNRLSGGLKRRLLIARALMHEPKILFMDEPTVGLDPAIRRRIWGLIKKIQADGTTIFLTTHYIEEAEFMAQRVALLDAGQIVTVDSPANLMAVLGEWAVDTLADNRLQTRYFKARDEAGDYAKSQAESCTVRRINLEDAFLAMTGKKIS
jgi:ABC-2 type transport system ATP-binding protein